MKRYLIFKDETSDKFWQIVVNGASFSVTYGKTGTAGTSQTKTFESEEKCLKEAEKLLNEKLKKGYVENLEGLKKADKKAISISQDCLKELNAMTATLADLPGSGKIDWDSEFTNYFNCLLQYWSKLASKSKKPIGIFDIRWDDSGTNRTIEFDYEENNDPEEAMMDGAMYNEPVIDFTILFESLQLSDKNKGKVFDQVKDFLCSAAVKLIIESTKSPNFESIKKKKKHYVVFSKFHDSESEVIFDSSRKEVNVDGFDSTAFAMACKEASSEKIKKLLNLLIEEKDKKIIEKASLPFYEMMQNIAIGDRWSSFEELIRIYPEKLFASLKLKVRSPLGDTREMLIHEAVICYCLLSKHTGIITRAIEMLPDKIAHPSIAFGFLQYFATSNDRQRLIKYIPQSLFYGQKTLIKKDPIFEKWLADKEVSEMLENSAKYM